jgi:hypothetical protein
VLAIYIICDIILTDNLFRPQAKEGIHVDNYCSCGMCRRAGGSPGMGLHSLTKGEVSLPHMWRSVLPTLESPFETFSLGGGMHELEVPVHHGY